MIAPPAPDDETPLLPSLLNEASTSAGHLAEPEIEASKQNAEIHISQTFDELATKTPPRLGNNGAHQESSALATNRVSPSYVTLTKPPKRSNVNVQQSSPKPSTSTQFVFSPEEVRPYPKAPPRKTAVRGRKTKRSAIYTDSPEKEAIRKEYEERQKRLKDKQVKKKVLELNTGKKNKGKGKGKKKKADTLVSSEDGDFYCLVCLEAYSDSRSGEKWVQCQGTCRLWSHLECTDSGRYYICQNCNESD